MEKYKDIERKIFLIKNSLEGNLSSEDTDELEEWLESAEENRMLFQRLQRKDILFEKLEFCRSVNSAGDWKSICLKAGISSRRHLYIRIARYAAAVVGMFLISLAYLKLTESEGKEQLVATMVTDSIRPGFRQAYIELVSGEKFILGDSVNRMVKNIKGMVLRENQEGLVLQTDSLLRNDLSTIEYNRIVIPRGGEYQLTLADGTKVWLNSDSRLEFPAAFTGEERKVRLSGEAYFQVKPDKLRPFRVEVNTMQVVVLGTSFNINAYNEEMKTTLVEGAVKVNVGGVYYSLSPGYEANVRHGKVVVEKADVYAQTAWKDGKFVFREKRLEDVLTILGRWYDVNIFYQNAAVKDLHFTGNVQRHATIGEVLKFLERTNLIRFSVVGRTVIVSD